MTITDLIKAFVRAPGDYAEEVRLRANEVHLTLATSDELAELLDSAEVPPELLLSVLGTDESEGISEVVDESDDDRVREVIQDCLLSDAPAAELQLVRGLDPIVLFQTTEAISTRIRRAAKRSERRDGWLNWLGSGVFLPWSSGVLLTSEALAVEVARFTGQWEATESEVAKPDSRAADLVAWAWHVSHRMPRVLRHFKVSKLNGTLTLGPMQAECWGQDLGTRLLPAARPSVPSPAESCVVVAERSRGAYAIELLTMMPFETMDRRFVLEVVAGLCASLPGPPEAEATCKIYASTLGELDAIQGCTIVRRQSPRSDWVWASDGFRAAATNLAVLECTDEALLAPSLAPALDLGVLRLR